MITYSTQRVRDSKIRKRLNVKFTYTSCLFWDFKTLHVIVMATYGGLVQ